MNPNFSIYFGTRKISFNQLSTYLASCIKFLKGMGIKESSRVAIIEENTVEYIILLIALWQLKAVAVPINPHWPLKMINAYTSRLNIQHSFKGKDIKNVVTYDARYELKMIKGEAFDLNQEATIIATSGSSGEAKAAVHTWGNHFYSAKGLNEVIGFAQEDRWLLSLPLYHVSGMGVVVRCLVAGAGLVVLTDKDIIKAITRSKVSHISLVPTQLLRLLNDDLNLAVLRTLKCILLGGTAIPSGLMDQAKALGLKVYGSYGLTEMTSTVVLGQTVLPYRELMISPDGEILVRGQTLFKGYVVGNKIVGADDWFATGDLGTVDAQGQLTVLGRRDNMFISAGENIYPEEIEKVLLNFKGVESAVVVPREDKEFGARPIAYIQLSSPNVLTGDPVFQEELKKHLAGYLPKFRIPVAFYPWPQELIAQGVKVSRKDFPSRI